MNILRFIIQGYLLQNPSKNGVASDTVPQIFGFLDLFCDTRLGRTFEGVAHVMLVISA